MAEGKFNKVGFIIVIVLLSVLIIGVLVGRYIVSTSLTKATNDLEQYVAANHSNLSFVKNGLDMTAIKNDPSRLNTTIVDLKTVLWPNVKNMGLPRIIFDIAADSAAAELNKKLVVNNDAEKKPSAFVDEKNNLTINSILNGVRLGVMRVVNIIVIIIVVVLAVILGIHILKSLKTLKSTK